MVLLLVMFIVALACFIRAKKNERDRVVVFAPNMQANAKKTYRNGVEVKPSEFDKGGARAAAINSSVNEDNHETLLDQEDEN